MNSSGDSSETWELHLYIVPPSQTEWFYWLGTPVYWIYFVIQRQLTLGCGTSIKTITNVRFVLVFVFLLKETEMIRVVRNENDVLQIVLLSFGVDVLVYLLKEKNERVKIDSVNQSDCREG